jgi:hypothetical protein
MTERENYEKISQDAILRARQADLAEYLIGLGVPLVKEGSRYRHREHDSLVFTQNAFYWNSRDEKGNAVDFLTRHLSDIGLFNMNFRDAVAELAGLAGFAAAQRPKAVEKPAPPAFALENLTLSAEMGRVIAYLCKSRKISYELVKGLIAQRLLFQEAVTYPDKVTCENREMYNALFPFYDGHGAIVGAESAGTLTGSRFKGVKEGSAYGYGYTLTFGENIKFVLFFESAIDLLSFVDIKQAQGKTLDGCRLVSLAGLKENIVERALELLESAVTPVLCVDNDSAGEVFIQEILKKHVNAKVYQPDAGYKDWNEQLCARK